MMHSVKRFTNRAMAITAVIATFSGCTTPPYLFEGNETPTGGKKCGPLNGYEGDCEKFIAQRDDLRALRRERGTIFYKELLDYRRARQSSLLTPIAEYPKVLLEANQARELMKFQKRLVRSEITKKNIFTTVAGTRSDAWTELGPLNHSGRVRSAAFGPQPTSIDSNGKYVYSSTSYRMWIAATTGGIWYSDNYDVVNPAQVRWSAVNDALGSLNITSIAIDPDNPDHIYAATGEGDLTSNPGESSAPHQQLSSAWFFGGVGIIKSEDGGRTWQPAGNATIKHSSDFTNVSRLITHKNGIDKAIIAATSGGIYISKDGTNWIKPDIALDQDNIPFSKVLDVKSGGGVLVASNQIGSIAYSLDNGLTWTVKYLGNLPRSPFVSLRRVETAYSKSDNKWYFSANVTNTGELYSVSNGDFNKRDLISAKVLPAVIVNGSNQGNFNNSIWVDPRNGKNILNGGLTVIRSGDQGKSFVRAMEYLSNFSKRELPHADIHCIESDPKYESLSSNFIYVCTDGGMFRLSGQPAWEDISESNSVTKYEKFWENINNGINTIQFYSGDGSTYSGNVEIVGGAQDNYTLVNYGGTAGANDWRAVKSGDGMLTRFAGGYIFAHEVPARITRIKRSANGKFDLSDYVTIPTSGGNFISFFAIKNNTQDIPSSLIATTTPGIEECTNLTTNSPTCRLIFPMDKLGANESVVALSYGADDTKIYFGTDKGSVWTNNPPAGCQRISEYVDYNGGKWYKLYPTALMVNFVQRWVTKISVASFDSNNILLTFGGGERDNIYLSENMGCSWRSISGQSTSGTQTLPSIPVYTITRHPAKGGWLYVGTDAGLFVSEDNGDTWYAGEGPANVAVEDLFWLKDGSSHNLFAATFGRGIWATDTVNPTAKINISGTVCSLTAVIEMDVNSLSVSKLGAVFVGALLANSWYFHNGYQWEFWRDTMEIRENDRFPKYWSGTLQSKYYIKVAENLDIRGLDGLQIYAGYGQESGGLLGELEAQKNMLSSGTYEKIWVIDTAKVPKC